MWYRPSRDTCSTVWSIQSLLVAQLGGGWVCCWFFAAARRTLQVTALVALPYPNVCCFLMALAYPSLGSLILSHIGATDVCDMCPHCRNPNTDMQHCRQYNVALYLLVRAADIWIKNFARRGSRVTASQPATHSPYLCTRTCACIQRQHSTSST